MHIIALSAEKFSYAPEVQNDLLWTVIGSPWGLPACWLVLINLITFFVFGLEGQAEGEKGNRPPGPGEESTASGGGRRQRGGLAGDEGLSS